MNLKENLEKNINNLIVDFPEDNRIPMIKAIEGSLWKGNKSGEACIELIKKIKEYDIFENHMQFLGGNGFSLTYYKLLDWMLDRARIVGAKETILDVDNYISNPNFNVNLIELVCNSSSENSYKFSNGAILTDINAIYKSKKYLNNSSFAEELTNRPLSIPTQTFIGGILSFDFEHPKRHYKNKSENGNKKVQIPFDKLNITKLCLSLTRSINYGVFGFGTTLITSDKIPMLLSGRVWQTKPSKTSGYGPQIIKIELKQTDKLLENFEKLDSKFQDKLIIPLEKFNNFGSGELLVDKAIELRICLESIFLNDGNKDQLRFRLALRSALFLGKSLEERKEIFKIVKEAYDITSTAVHNGKLSKKMKTDTLTKAAEFAKKALIKLINEGEVNWEDLELS